jgi:hypothetical protein
MVAAQSNQRMILPQGAHQVGTPVPLEKPDIHFGRRGGIEIHRRLFKLATKNRTRRPEPRTPPGVTLEAFILEVPGFSLALTYMPVPGVKQMNPPLKNRCPNFQQASPKGKYSLLFGVVSVNVCKSHGTLASDVSLFG